MNSFNQLFSANSKIFYRNKSGFFWTLAMPAFIYVALSVLPISNSFGKGADYSDFILPGIIAMVIMQGGVYGLAYWMTDLKARGVIKRLNATPIRPWELVLSLVASRILVIFGQIIILTLLGVFFFKAQFAGNVLSVATFGVLGGGIFLTMGLLISSFATSYDSVAPITSAIGLPMTFLGNIFYPISVLPHGLQVFAKFLPITYLADGMRQAYSLPFSWTSFWPNVVILTAWLFGILLLTAKVFKLKE